MEKIITAFLMLRGGFCGFPASEGGQLKGTKTGCVSNAQSRRSSSAAANAPDKRQFFVSIIWSSNGKETTPGPQVRTMV
jgi:hypothetical protein